MSTLLTRNHLVSHSLINHILTLVLLCTLPAIGCAQKLPLGHLEGTLITNENEHLKSQPVGIDVTLPKAKPWHIHRYGKVRVTDSQNNLISNFDVSSSNKKQVQLKIPTLREAPFIFNEVAVGDRGLKKSCYLAQDDWQGEFCFDSMEFMLRISNPQKLVVLKLLGNTFSKEPAFPLEPPVKLTMKEAVQKAFDSNLDTRIGFEHLVQAKNLVTVAYLNLIPHLTTNLIWNASFGYISAIATLQGLTPFLLPTYWIQAKESEWDLKIKSDAQIIQKADLAAMVEQMGYAYARDRKIAQVQDLAIQSVIQFQNHLRELEVRGLLKAGTADSMQNLINSLTGDYEKTGQIILDEQYALSQALGYHNPEAITDILLSDRLPSGPLNPLIKEDLAIQVSQRSFELQQIDYLHEIAKLKKVELYFNWIDPSGDPKTSFGFNTIPQLKVSNSQIQEIELKREQMKIAVYQNAYKITNEFNGTIPYLNVPHVNSETINSVQNFDKTLNDCLSTEGLDRDTAYSAIMELVSNQIGDIANEAAYLIAQSKVDRIMLGGYYEFLLPHLNTY